MNVESFKFNPCMQDLRKMLELDLELDNRHLKKIRFSKGLVGLGWKMLPNFRVLKNSGA